MPDFLETLNLGSDDSNRRIIVVGDIHGMMKPFE